MKASETLQRQARLEISKDVSVQLRRALSAKVKVLFALNLHKLAFDSDNKSELSDCKAPCSCC